MVANLRQCLIGFLQNISLALVRAMIGNSFMDSRCLYIERLTSLSFEASQEISVEVFIKELSLRKLSQEQKERLFLHVCTLFNVNDVPDAAITAFEKTCGGTIHYSQEGEDIALERIFSEKKNGFFVDVGAHHATRFSNTYALYKKGWRGVNIDATPGSMNSFDSVRPEDVNIEIAVSVRNEKLIFNMFKEPALNTFDMVLANTYIANGWELNHAVEFTPEPLADILDKHLVPGQLIDLLCIDVEGEELAVLSSNNWDRYCPETIVIEVLDTPLETLNTHPAITFLTDRGFVPMLRLTNSVILRRHQS